MGLELMIAGKTFTGRRFAEKAESLADREDTVLRPGRGVGVVPLGAADRAEQHPVDLLADLQRLVRQRVPKSSMALPPILP